MRRTLVLISLAFLILFSSVQTSHAQTAPVDTTKLKTLIHYLSELEFQIALQNYVEKLFVDYGMENLPREKYLISLMRLVNHEMRNRIKNPQIASQKYFKELAQDLNELRDLKKRLKAAGISELNSFIDELEARMNLTIQREEVDYKKKKVFEDALQLLYVAEEMIKMDKMRSPQNLNQKISASKDKLLNAFGEVGSTENVKIDVPVNIFGLFEEWKKNQEYDYTRRLLDIKLIRIKLIKSGTLAQEQRMFNDQLRYAYQVFNTYDYDLADRLLEDLIKTYSQFGVKNFEDVYFYWGESNFALGRFLRAHRIYEEFLQQYPGSSFLPRVYARLIEIDNTLNRPRELLSYFTKYQNVASPTDREYYDIQFVAGLTLYKQSDLNKAMDIFLGFPPESPYYPFAQYLVGTIYAAGQNYDMATDVFQKLSLSKTTPFGIYCRSLYKLALIHYEQGSYLSAIEALSFIPESYSRYDKVLNALAWSFFKFEQTGITDPARRDYSQAKYYAQRLLDEYYASEHRMEAESLLGYIYQLENKPGLAIDFYKEVYQSKVRKKDITDYLEERDRLDSLYSEAKAVEENAVRKNNPQAYIRASDVAASLDEKLAQMDLAELSPVGSAVMEELNGLLYQLSQLRQLKSEAELKGNHAAAAKIDSMMLRISAVVSMFPESILTQVQSYNLFDAYPVARKVSEYDYRTKKYSRMRAEIQNELNMIDSQIQALQQKIEREKRRGNYQKVVSLEQEIARLREIRKKDDQLYAASFRLSPGENYPEFDQWGDFGAFGIIDVNFGQRDRLEKKLGDVSLLYTRVNDLLKNRRETIENKLKRIEAEIRFMTMKVRLEERVRLRAEREREFRENYFDQRTSEFEEQ